MSTEKKQPLLTPIMRWFMLAMVLANIAGSMGSMMVPLYLSELGASITQVGTALRVSMIRDRCRLSMSG